MSLPALLEEVLCEVEGTVTCCFRTEERATPCQALTCENACVILTCEFLVHTVHVTDFAATNAYVTSRDILIRADIVPQFEHEAPGRSA